MSSDFFGDGCKEDSKVEGVQAEGETRWKMLGPGDDLAGKVDPPV